MIVFGLRTGGFTVPALKRGRGFALLGLVILAACHGLSCHKKSGGLLVPKTNTADLSDCTRIEARYLPSTKDYFLRTRGEQRFVNPEDFGELFSREVFLIDDRERITALARKMAGMAPVDRSTDIPGVKRLPRAEEAARVTFYHGDREVASFSFRQSGYVVTEDGEWFHLQGTGLSLSDFTPGVQPLIFRLECAHRIRSLPSDWAPYIQVAPTPYPPADRWCDATLELFLKLHGHGYGVGPDFATQAESCFRCPAAREGRCHYAINPDCRRDSPPDTVLLFETTGGWNQHGGPELFTLDNHDPKGGCVLLNDGTVKFVHTEEELKQLRWK
jgi:hypothetical protein